MIELTEKQRRALDDQSEQPPVAVDPQQKFPPGWDEKRVKEVLAHYENQTEDEEHAEIEAENITLMDIPTDLVPKVRALLAGKRSA